jgi:hypothetical protein
MSKSTSKNILRIVLGLVLLVFVLLKVVDVRARSKTKQIYDAISTMLVTPSEDGDNTVSQAKIHELFGEPTSGFSPGEKKWTDVYTSRGAFKSYSTKVEYSDRVKKLLVSVSTE